MAPTSSDWVGPSPRVAALIRDAASLLIAAPEDVFADVDAAVLDERAGPIAADPALAAAVRRTNHANLLHWAHANVGAPGAPVRPNVGPEALTLARDLVRRGLDVTALHGFRVGQNIGWQRWMDLAFQLTSDPGELREFLNVSARSIFSYVDAQLTELTVQIERERDMLTRGTHAQRLEVVALILEGAPIAEARASARLGYSLRRRHTAAIVWSEQPEVDPARLERAAEAVGHAATARPLTVVASAAALWVWVGTPVGSDPPGPRGAPVEVELDRARLRDELAELGEVRVALGSTGDGLGGFRRSHLDALATQRLMQRITDVRLAAYEDVRLVALSTQDDERADEFVARTLGELAHAPAELRETARVYLREAYNATRTARVLYTHRNTVLARLARIDQLLPAPLRGRGLQVGLALEILHWRGGEHG